MASELRHHAGEVSSCQVRAEGDLAGRLRVGLDVRGRPGGVDGEDQVSSVQRLPREPVEGTQAHLLEALALGQDPVVVPAGQQLLTAEQGEQVGLLVVGLRKLGELGGATDLRHVDLDLRVEPDEGAPGVQQAGTSVLGLHHRPAQARERSLVGAVGPQQAGDVRTGPLTAQSQERDQALFSVAEPQLGPVVDELPAPEQAQADATLRCTVALRHGEHPRTLFPPGRETTQATDRSRAGEVESAAGRGYSPIIATTA